MKVRKHSWILIPLAIALGVLLGRSGSLQRALGNNPLLTIANTADTTWGAVKAAAFRIYRINDRGTIHDYLKSHTVRKLQIGAGGNDVDGWLNSDIEPSSKEIYLDATHRYPFPDGSFQYVFSEHVIEHVSWEGGLAMLRECHRVLAPGGKVRTVTPNLTKFIQLLGGVADPAERQYIDAKLRFHGWPLTPVPGAYILNEEVRDWGHQFLYDPATLRKSLELAGFQQINEYPVGEKTDPVFQEAELRTRYPGSDLWVVNNWEAMAIEATR
jgi:predicted SAM-dependent methyltransferase